MDSEQLEAKVKMLEDKIRTLEDIEEIKRLQRIYGYYLDNRMGDEITDLFSDDTESVEIDGVYLGKEGVKRVFEGRFGGGIIPGQFAQHAIEQPVITIDAGGQTAKGRWRVVWCMAVPVEGEMTAVWGHGLYENEYKKEDGKWKIKKLRLFPLYRTTFDDGWVKKPAVGIVPCMELPEEIRPNRPGGDIQIYPKGDIVPFHYKHPITGKESVHVKTSKDGTKS